MARYSSTRVSSRSQRDGSRLDALRRLGTSGAALRTWLTSQGRQLTPELRCPHDRR